MKNLRRYRILRISLKTFQCPDDHNPRIARDTPSNEIANPSKSQSCSPEFHWRFMLGLLVLETMSTLFLRLTDPIWSRIFRLIPVSHRYSAKQRVSIIDFNLTTNRNSCNFVVPLEYWSGWWMHFNIVQEQHPDLAIVTSETELIPEKTFAFWNDLGENWHRQLSTGWG